MKLKEPQQIVESIVDLAKQIENTAKASVIISEIISRRDKFNSCAERINNQLRKVCRQHQWKLVNHDNITEKELNRGGIYLNYRGNQRLFKNFEVNLN